MRVEQRRRNMMHVRKGRMHVLQAAPTLVVRVLSRLPPKKWRVRGAARHHPRLLTSHTPLLMAALGRAHRRLLLSLLPQLLAAAAAAVAKAAAIVTVTAAVAAAATRVLRQRGALPMRYCPSTRHAAEVELVRS